ncbi:MAG: hypothetical protein ABJQ29_11390 [Luteolibacter sp.]
MKTKLEFSNILNARQTVEARASNVSRLGSEVVVAERKLEDARRDDGTSDPEEIVKRSEAARRDLEIRKIEANRAAVKRDEAEEKYGVLVQSEAPTIMDHLNKISKHKAEEIEKMIIPILGASALKTRELNHLISACPAVHGPKSVALRIRLALELPSSNGRTRPDLIANVLSAGEYL